MDRVTMTFVEHARWPVIGAALLFCIGLSAEAHAQMRLDAPDVERCAAQIHAGLRPLSVVPAHRPLVLRTVLHTLAHVPACHLPGDVRRALQLSYRWVRLSGTQLCTPSGQTVEQRLERAERRALARPHAPECTFGGNSDSAWVASRACRPAAAPVRDLMTDSNEYLFAGRTRLLVVQVVDALAASSPRLVASAQLVWMVASWMGNVEVIGQTWEPSATFQRMMEDLRARHVRFDRYEAGRIAR